MVTAIPQPKEQPYLYMPAPPMIQTRSTRINHFLGLADLYLQLGQPKIYVVEPRVNNQYQPDAYTRLSEPLMIEYQPSKKSTEAIQEKVNRFTQSYIKKNHDARILWIVTPIQYKLKVPGGFKVIQSEVLDVENLTHPFTVRST